MRLSIDSFDCAFVEIEKAAPIQVLLLRQLPGRDRSDYWLGQLEIPLQVPISGEPQTVTYVIVASRWVGHPIRPGILGVPINLAFVLDESQVDEETVNFSKSRFVAIGSADEVSAPNQSKKAQQTTSGYVDRFFGKGTGG
jgi:hypothetical protein